MNDWEHHANISLRSLGEALQRGQLDRQEYRRRRRRILAAGHDRQDRTRPNVLAATIPSESHPARPFAMPRFLWILCVCGIGLLLLVLAAVGISWAVGHGIPG